MTKYNEAGIRLKLYQELDDIVTTMKNLATVELHRVTQAETFQEKTYRSCLKAAAFFKQQRRQSIRITGNDSLLLLIGSERGFCGNFNEQIWRCFQDLPAADRVLVVGDRLATQFESESKAIFFPGATTVQQVLPLSQNLVDYLLNNNFPERLILLCHDSHEVRQIELLPEPEFPEIKQLSSLHTYMHSTELARELGWQCLQQALVYYLLVSLKAESRFRLQQMEGAKDHLDQLIHTLRLRSNVLRQQEIVEEIEVMLSEQPNFFG
jgi:F-type H+-transporting ATPase subunit gamma